MIKSTEESYPLLVALFQERPDLFEPIDPHAQEYEDGPELLYCDGEADLIEIEGQTYRFFWEAVENFGIEEDLDFFED